MIILKDGLQKQKLEHFDVVHKTFDIQCSF